MLRLACLALIGCAASPPVPRARDCSPCTDRAPVALERIALSSPSVPVDLPARERKGYVGRVAFDERRHQLWIPVSTGQVFVVDREPGRVTRTLAVPARPDGQLPGSWGPSSVTLAGEVAYITNSSDYTICGYDRTTLGRLGCVRTASMPISVTLVARNELWVTTHETGIFAFEITAPGRLRERARIAMPSGATGHAVDLASGRMFAIPGGKPAIAVIDIARRTRTATWNVDCGGDGPRDVAYDPMHDRLLVACRKRIVVLDAARGGVPVSSFALDGIDRIAFSDARRELYIPLVAKSRLVVARLGDDGSATIIRLHRTSTDGQPPVVAEDGTAFVRHWDGDRLLMIRN